MASSLLAMKVSAIQAIPNSAIIATMPDLKIGVPGMSVAFTLQKSTISAAAVSMSIWMIGVTDSGSTPPPSAEIVGRMPSKKPKTQIASDGAQEDRDAALGVGQQHDVLGGCRRLRPRRRPRGAGTRRRPRGPSRDGS